MDRWPSFCYRTDLQVKALHQICCLVGPSSSETQLPHLGEPGEAEASGTTSVSLQVRSTRTHWEPSCASSMPWPASARFATAHDSSLENGFSKYCVKMEGKNNIHGGSQASGLQKSNAYHQSHHKNYFTRHFLWPSAARPLPCPNSGELLADITPLAPHAVFGVSWPMTYNSMRPGRGGSSSLNTDLPTSSVFRVQQQESYGRENGLGILWLTIGPTQVLAAAFLCGRVWRHFLGLRDSHHQDPLRQVQPEA